MSDHWTKKRQRRIRQQYFIKNWWYIHKPKYELPLNITLTRLASRKLDDDNLRSAFKSIRDEIASRIFPGKAPGRADDSIELIWHYKQETAKGYAIRIEFSYCEFPKT